MYKYEELNPFGKYYAVRTDVENYIIKGDWSEVQKKINSLPKDGRIFSGCSTKEEAENWVSKSPFIIKSKEDLEKFDLVIDVSFQDKGYIDEVVCVSKINSNKYPELKDSIGVSTVIPRSGSKFRIFTTAIDRVINLLLENNLDPKTINLAIASSERIQMYLIEGIHTAKDDKVSAVNEVNELKKQLNSVTFFIRK